MTIFWTFYNTPRNGEYFEAHLQTSTGDHIFQFNLAVHSRGDSNWIVASQDYVVGNEADRLRIRGLRGQDLLLLVRDSNGTEKRIRYSADMNWVDAGDIGTAQNIADYRKYFEDSLGLTEEQMYCKALYDEYLHLDAKTHIVVRDYDPNVPIEGKHIEYQDLLRKKILAKELVNTCRDYFDDKPAEWHDLKLETRD